MQIQYQYTYTDGSGVENKVGAAAYSPTMNTTSHQHLGSEKQYNVFTGEVTAVQLAVEILRDDHDFRTCYIYSDSQAAIKRSTSHEDNLDNKLSKNSWIASTK